MVVIIVESKEKPKVNPQTGKQFTGDPTGTVPWDVWRHVLQALPSEMPVSFWSLVPWTHPPPYGLTSFQTGFSRVALIMLSWACCPSEETHTARFWRYPPMSWHSLSLGSFGHRAIPGPVAVTSGMESLIGGSTQHPPVLGPPRRQGMKVGWAGPFLWGGIIAEGAVRDR